MKNKIAVVVLNYHNYLETICCVDNMLRLDINADIVIVDNNSTNDSVAQLQKKYMNMEHVYIVCNNENHGYSAGNNIGFKYISQHIPSVEYMCIMNPDTLFDDAILLDRLSEKLANHEDAAVIAPVMVQHSIWDIKHTYWDIPNTWDIFRRQFVLCKKRNQTALKIMKDKTAYVGVVSGSFLMIKKTALEMIGYLDEGTFLYGEENLLALDLRCIGMRELISVTDIFNHNHKIRIQRESLENKLKVAKIASDSRIYVFRKHFNNALIPALKLIHRINVVIITGKHLAGSLRKFTGYEKLR